MIDKLRKKMIWVCCTAVIMVFALIFGVIYISGNRQLDSNMDMMADRIAEGNGVFRPFDQDDPMPPGMSQSPGFFTDETPFSTRFFTIWIAEDGKIIGVNLDSVSSVTRETAYEYAQKVLQSEKTRGWQGDYRYKVFSAVRGTGIVFVDGSMNRSTTLSLLWTAAAVLVGCMLIISVVIVVVSKRVVRPIAQSYEKQKQFITDANHELKTPLTLILTNLEIVESELGHSEWLDDIRTEGQRMSDLVAQLTALSRLDEDAPTMMTADFSFSDVCSDTVSEFAPLVDSKGLTMTAYIQPDLHLQGDEGAIRRLVTILIDNAVKYCVPMGKITLVLEGQRQKTLRVENSCTDVDNIALDRLFDRFYREDKARTSSNSFGIGLSLAKAIAEKHHGEIKAYKAADGIIGFRVLLSK